MENLHSIVVGVDFSDCSVSAVRQAGRLARRDEAKLAVVHAVTPDFIEQYRESFVTPEADIIGKIHEQVSNFARANLGPDAEFEAQVFVGRPFVEMLRASQEYSADLLVLGSHGLTVGSGSAGNLASKCVRKAPLPVLLVRDAHGDGFTKVAAGVDFSDTSFLALKEAALIAGREGAALEVVHVHCPPWMWVNHYSYDLKAFPKGDYEQEYRAVLQDQMEAFVSPVRELYPDLEFSTQIIERESSLQGLKNYLSESASDLVVIGTRGRSGAKSLLLGTTAERLLHDSPCSVLTVKPEGFQYTI